MQRLGFPPTVTHNTPLTSRRSRIYIYRCLCRTHRLGPRRHSLIGRGSHRYACAACGGALKFSNRMEWREPGH